MDFVIGLLLTIVIILVLINFTSVSLSDSNNATQQQCGNNSLFSSFWGNNGGGIGSGGYPQSQSVPLVPQPILASAPSALNNKVNLEQQTYDYHKYFFVN